MAHDFRIVSGTANEELAELIARGLGVRLAASEVSRFPDGEIAVQLLEPVRRKEVFIVQPTALPVSEHLVEPQIEGFFRVPVDNLTAVPTLTAALEGRLAPGTVVVSPDAGRVRMATDYANALGTSVAVLHKRRRSGTETEITHVVGEVRDRACLIIDDMIATGGTLVEAIEALLTAGARPDLTIAATHGLLLGGAREKLDHQAVRAVVVTDTVAVPAGDWPKLSVVTVAPVIAPAIERFVADGSLADLYVPPPSALRRPA